jgi:hypothetical protein
VAVAEQARDDVPVVLEALALVGEAFEARHRIVIDPDPRQRFENGLFGLYGRPLAVGVLEAQQEEALVVAGECPVRSA